jgi:predicted phage terminase large subunit-like protein
MPPPALRALLDEPAIDREIVRREALKGRGLYAFVKLAWEQVEGENTPFIDSPHIELVCRHLEAVSTGKIDRLVINIPPGCSKSTLCGVLWPLYEWGPLGLGHLKYMCASFDQQVSLRDADRVRRVLESEWWAVRWGSRSTFDKPVEIMRAVTPGASKATSAKGLFYTSRNGMRMSTMMGGKALGFHADRQIFDDVHKVADIRAGGDAARAALQRTKDLYQSTFASRKRGKVARVLVMQRVHHDDMSAMCIAEGWTHLCLPAEYDPDRHCKTEIGEDWRTVKGELLCPQRIGVGDRIAIELAKKEMGSKVFASQMNQSPSVDGGTIFQRAWLTKRWTSVPDNALWYISCDLTFKGASTSDYAVLQVWAKAGNDFYLIDQIRARMGFTETVTALENLSRKWPQAYRVLVEDKANGSAVIDTLKNKIPGLIPVEPRGGKESRANAVTTVFENGHVWLPEAPWVSDFVEELCSFPLGRHDDMCDAATQAISDQMNIGASRYARLAAALEARDRPTAGVYVEQPGDILVRTASPAGLGEQLKGLWAVVPARGDNVHAVRAGGAAEAVRFQIQRYGWAHLV